MKEVLEKLAPYLPYQVKTECEVVRPVNSILRTGSAKHAHKLDANLYFDISEAPDFYLSIKPYLRSFPQLAKPILHKGVEVIPAIEVARLALAFGKITAEEIIQEKDFIVVRTDLGLLQISKDFTIMRPGSVSGIVYNQVQIVDLLRSMHFALPPWKEGEYIGKED